MSKQDKSSVIQKIDRKWVRESKRTFSEYPVLPRTGVLGEEETWLELAQFYKDDLKWLLSLDHHKFWSHMIYSEKAHELLVSFLKGYPPNCLKRRFLAREDMKNTFKEIEHLVFLVFLRLSTEKESEGCFVRDFREVIYNNYLFTVPIILDICLIYGTSNSELVKRMINNIITLAPDFLDDFQEVIPHFIHVLKVVKEKFSTSDTVFKAKEEKRDLKLNEIEDLILYLCDTVATVQIFLDLYPNVCQLFSKSELITEITNFYSNGLPVICKHFSEKYQPLDESSLAYNLIEYTRIDMLKIVKSVFDFVLSESEEIPEKKNETVNEYLTLVTKLLAEPVFFSDYNLLNSVEFEVQYAIKNCQNVDLTKVNQILEGITATDTSREEKQKEIFPHEEVETSIKFDSLVTEIKDILPHLADDFIKLCLNHYKNNTERVIAAVLENSLPPELNGNAGRIGKENHEAEGMMEFKGKHKSKHRSLNEMLNDREEISRMKERYTQLYEYVADETYDDEYDDTYDESVDILLREGDETWRRPLVVPRVLRAGCETAAEDEYEDEDVDEEEGRDERDDNSRRDNFVENPAIWREKMEQRRSEQYRRDVAGRGRGQGQSKEVLRNREFKESHKSFIANHNRKKQAGRKMARGMIPS